MLEELAEDLDGTFASVVRAHQDGLYSVVLAILAGREDAEEITQDAFVRAYRALQTYDPDRIRALRLKPWLVQIAVNLARNHLRRRRTAEIPLNNDHDPAGPESDEPLAHAERRVEARAWARRLMKVPVRYRIPVILRHVEGLSYAEIAEVLGRPEGTVKVQVRRGIGLLQQCYETEREEVLV
jgi:RNA polymerase sigma-70 factor (ECF subfamily)